METTFAMDFPTPPSDANPELMRKWMMSVSTWVKNVVLQGIQCPMLTQDQINQITTLDQSGKIWFNTTSGKFNVGEIAGGVLTIKEVVTT